MRRIALARVARSPAPNYPKPPRPGSLAPNVGDPGPSDSALAAASGWRLHRLAADRPAVRCASRDLCSGARHSAPCALGGIRDTARVLRISPTTVIAVLKKVAALQHATHVLVPPRLHVGRGQ